MMMTIIICQVISFLQVGSKAELAMVMSVLAGQPGCNLICNGYKDAEYMELVTGGSGGGVGGKGVLGRGEGGGRFIRLEFLVTIFV